MSDEVSLSASARAAGAQTYLVYYYPQCPPEEVVVQTVLAWSHQEAVERALDQPFEHLEQMAPGEAIRDWSEYPHQMDFDLLSSEGHGNVETLKPTCGFVLPVEDDGRARLRLLDLEKMSQHDRDRVRVLDEVWEINAALEERGEVVRYLLLGEVTPMGQGPPEPKTLWPF